MTSPRQKVIVGPLQLGDHLCGRIGCGKNAAFLIIDVLANGDRGSRRALCDLHYSEDILNNDFCEIVLPG